MLLRLLFGFAEKKKNNEDSNVVNTKSSQR